MTAQPNRSDNTDKFILDDGNLDENKGVDTLKQVTDAAVEEHLKAANEPIEIPDEPEVDDIEVASPVDQDDAPNIAKDLGKITEDPIPVPPEQEAEDPNDPIVEHVDLSDAQWAGGIVDQAPREVRGGDDIVHAVYEYHRSIADVMDTMTDMIMGCINEIEEIKARFQRLP
jgi:hypothetical protein